MVEEYTHDFERTKGKTIELISLETKKGAVMAKLYDIVRYPALLVLRDDDQLMKHWEGDSLPLMDEVVGYFN
ncbi:hypothetical protein HY003_04345 [Candidatus Saccharibacteria bacterium]|nr:hypothetical protein [Candidatus Saccharibacteria bacterium]